jgi:hypothetical protein
MNRRVAELSCRSAAMERFIPNLGAANFSSRLAEGLPIL